MERSSDVRRATRKTLSVLRPEHAADAPRSDAVDATRRHFMERVVWWGDGIARPVVRALRDPTLETVPTILGFLTLSLAAFAARS